MEIPFTKFTKDEIKEIDLNNVYTEEEKELLTERLENFIMYYNREVIDRFGLELSKKETIELRNVIRSLKSINKNIIKADKEMILQTFAIPGYMVDKIKTKIIKENNLDINDYK